MSASNGLLPSPDLDSSPSRPRLNGTASRQPRGPPMEMDNEPHGQQVWLAPRRPKVERTVSASNNEEDGFGCFLRLHQAHLAADPSVDEHFSSYLARSWRHPTTRSARSPPPSPAVVEVAQSTPLHKAPPPLAAFASSTSRWASRDGETHPAVELDRLPPSVAAEVVRHVPTPAPPPSPAATETFDEVKAKVEVPSVEETAAEPVPQEPSYNDLLQTHSSATSRWASTPPISKLVGLSVRGAAARAASVKTSGWEAPTPEKLSELTGWGDETDDDPPSRSSSDSPTTDRGWGSSETSVDDDCEVQQPQRKSPKRDKPLARRPTAPPSSASTVRPRRALTNRTSRTADTRLSQATSFYEVVNMHTAFQPPNSHAGYPHKDIDLTTLDFQQIRLASGGPQLPRIPLEVIDAKIADIRARHRRDRHQRLTRAQVLDQALDEIVEIDEAPLPSALDYDAERERNRRAKLAIIAAYNATYAAREEQRVREKSPTRRENRANLADHDWNDEVTAVVARDGVAKVPVDDATVLATLSPPNPNWDDLAASPQITHKHTTDKETGWGDPVVVESDSSSGWDGASAGVVSPQDDEEEW